MRRNIQVPPILKQPTSHYETNNNRHESQEHLPTPPGSKGVKFRDTEYLSKKKSGGAHLDQRS